MNQINNEPCCDVCPQTNSLVEHHDSYKPEIVRILCRKHHIKFHKEHPEVKRPKNFTYKLKLLENDFIVWNFQVPTEIDRVVEKILSRAFYVTKAEFVRDAVRKKLEEYGVKVTVNKKTEENDKNDPK